MISRHHATLIRDSAADSGWRLKDANSANGTFVNGKRITNHLLTDGDIVVFGRLDRDSEFRFRFVAESTLQISCILGLMLQKIIQKVIIKSVQRNASK